MRTHIRRSAEQWQVLIDEQSESGLSAPQFCNQRNIGYASFCQWRKRLSNPTDPTQQEPTFLAVNARAPDSDNPRWLVELELCSDIVLRIGKL